VRIGLMCVGGGARWVWERCLVCVVVGLCLDGVLVWEYFLWG